MNVSELLILWEDHCFNDACMLPPEKQWEFLRKLARRYDVAAWFESITGKPLSDQMAK